MPSLDISKKPRLTDAAPPEGESVFGGREVEAQPKNRSKLSEYLRSLVHERERTLGDTGETVTEKPRLLQFLADSFTKTPDFYRTQRLTDMEEVQDRYGTRVAALAPESAELGLLGNKLGLGGQVGQLAGLGSPEQRESMIEASGVPMDDYSRTVAAITSTMQKQQAATKQAALDAEKADKQAERDARAKEGELNRKMQISVAQIRTAADKMRLAAKNDPKSVDPVKVHAIVQRRAAIIAQIRRSDNMSTSEKNAAVNEIGQATAGLDALLAPSPPAPPATPKKPGGGKPAPYRPVDKKQTIESWRTMGYSDADIEAALAGL